MKRGQAAIEFLVFVGIAMLLLVVYIGISNHYLNLLYEQEKIISGDDFLQTIANEFNVAGRVEDGYKRTIELPSKIGKYDYSLYIGNGINKLGTGQGSSREVVLYSENKEYVKTLSTSVVDECLGYDDNTCGQGNNCEWKNSKCFSIINKNPKGKLIIEKRYNTEEGYSEVVFSVIP